MSLTTTMPPGRRPVSGGTFARHGMSIGAVVLAFAVVGVALATATSTWLAGAGLAAAAGVAALLAGLVRRSSRAIALAAGLLAAGAAFAGLGRPGTAGASLTAALLGSLTLVTAELAWWSIELAATVPAGPPDWGRIARIFGFALGGGIFGATAVGLVYAHARTGSLAIVIAGALAACLVVGLAMLLAPRPTGD